MGCLLEERSACYLPVANRLSHPSPKDSSRQNEEAGSAKIVQIRHERAASQLHDVHRIMTLFHQSVALQAIPPFPRTQEHITNDWRSI